MSNLPRLLRFAALEKPADISQDANEHRLRQFARECVLLAWMIRSEEARQAGREFVARAVGKTESRERFNLAASLQRAKVRKHRDAAEREDRSRPQNLEFPLKIGAAIRQLRGQRLVCRRRAANHGRDVRILEFEAVVAARRCRLVRKSSVI